jgi:hypothetical protein
MTVARGYYTGPDVAGTAAREAKKSPGKVAIPINVWQEPLLTGIIAGVSLSYCRDAF